MNGRGRSRFRIKTSLIALALCWVLPMALRAQTENSGADRPTDQSFDAAEADGPQPKSDAPKRNEFEWEALTLRVGGGFLLDTATYDQDNNSKEQMELRPATKLRDLRILLKGRFKFAPRFSYSIGYMYDGALQEWRFRQTGIMIDVPEWSGNFFIGRTKEGFSTNKLMVGYHGWTNERAAANDAFLPILADGVKWTGTGFGNLLVYNLGWFVGSLGESQSYVKNDSQFAARAVWLPLVNSEKKAVLHIAVEARHGKSLDGNLQFRSKPESFPAQSYAVDTGKFPANSSTMEGIEVYYRPGPLMFGSEYFWNQVDAPSMRNPRFHGGEIFASYLFTGEVRGYNQRGAFFEAVSPKRSVFSGGRGAWELVVRYSQVDLDSELITGGTFKRLTPMVNWHLSDNMRLEFAYGYSVLDRLNIQGTTQYFQTRLQLTL